MKLIKALYLNNRFFYVAIGLILIFILSFIFDVFFNVAVALFYVVLLILLVDLLMLFNVKKGLFGRRITPEKLSNGDENLISIYLESYYPFRVKIKAIDEIPFQFQKRDLRFDLSLRKNETRIINYHLRPVTRGVYSFGSVNVFVTGTIGFISRRFRFSQDAEVPVYPSYIQMRKYELLAISNNLTEAGLKKIRRIGHQMEFEQIKDYVPGDDYRTINWKATARRNQLMVNAYQDEKAQQVYCLIDKGRAMKMPFEGMTLLDYAINASLVISNIAVKKDDKAGLVAFQRRLDSFLPAARRNNQMALIQEALYRQETSFKESDLSRVYSLVRRKIRQRSLLLLFTNFESVASLERQSVYLRRLAKMHLLTVIFFKNTELYSIIEQRAENLEEIYTKTIAEKFDFEKRLIVKELNRHGVYTILTEPQKLTVNTINKYLEFKARGLI